MTRVFVASAVIALALLGCTPRHPVSDRIFTEAAKSKSFDLARLTDFTWDQAAVFSPYTPPDRICAALPASWRECTSTYPNGVDEGSFLLVFVRGGSVVHQELHPRPHGEFCRADCLLQFKATEAGFDVDVADASKAADGRKIFSRRLTRAAP